MGLDGAEGACSRYRLFLMDDIRRKPYMRKKRSGLRMLYCVVCEKRRCKLVCKRLFIALPFFCRAFIYKKFEYLWYNGVAQLELHKQHMVTIEKHV